MHVGIDWLQRQRFGIDTGPGGIRFSFELISKTSGSITVSVTPQNYDGNYYWAPIEAATLREKYGDDPDKIDEILSTYDKARQNYYNYHTCQKWGDYRNYNLSINSSYITEEEAVGLIADYVERRTYR